MRLKCSKAISDDETAEIMRCGVASVRIYHHRGRRKSRAVQMGNEAGVSRKEPEALDVHLLRPGVTLTE